MSVNATLRSYLRTKQFCILSVIVSVFLAGFISGCITVEPRFVDFSTPQQEKQSDKDEVNDPDYYYEKGLKALDEGTSLSIYVEPISIRAKLKEAAENFEMVKKLIPDWPEIYYYLGLIYEQLDYYDKAASNFREYLKLARNINEENKKDIIDKIALNENNYKRLEEAKEKLADGKWIRVEIIPEMKLCGPSDIPVTPFLKRNGNYYAKNPLMESYVEDERFRSRNSRGFINSILSNAWSKVEFDGRFFINKFYHLIPFDDGSIWIKPYLFLGEIVLEKENPKVVLNSYSFADFDSSKREFLCYKKVKKPVRFTSTEKASNYLEFMLTSIKVEDVLKSQNYSYCLSAKITYILR